MYTWELINFVNQRNGKVSREDYIKLVSRVDNPQIKDVNVFKRHDGGMTTMVTTFDNGNFSFDVDGL